MALDSSTLDILNLVSFRHYYGFRHFNVRHCVIIDFYLDITTVLDISTLGIFNLVIFSDMVVYISTLDIIYIYIFFKTLYLKIFQL